MGEISTKALRAQEIQIQNQRSKQKNDRMSEHFCGFFFSSLLIWVLGIEPLASSMPSTDSVIELHLQHNE